jgi:glycosyltransferase involved in cell wall biosynthesis
LVARGQERAEAIRAAVRERHAPAYAARALVRREHDEAPRFALVRVDRADVLLTAACDLEPRRVSCDEYAREVDDCGGGAWPTDELVPCITVLTTEAALNRLTERNLLPGVLLRLQAELRHHEVVGVTSGSDPVVTLAMRTRTLHLRGAEDLEPDGVVELHGLGDLPALPHEGLPGLGTGRFTGLPALPVPAHSQRFAQLHIDDFETTLPWHGRGEGRNVVLVAPWLRSDGAHRGAVELLRAAQALDPALGLHLVLTDDTDLRGIPLELFETVTPGPLMGGADVVVHAGAPVPSAGALHVALDDSAARHLDGMVDVYLAPTPTAAARLANLEAVPDKITLTPAATVLRPDDPAHSRRLAADKNRRKAAGAVLFRGPADLRRALDVEVDEVFTPESLERAGAVVLAGAVDPTLALDAMAFGCLVIAVGRTGLEDILVHGQTGLVVDAADLANALSSVGDHARERDAGVELALATSWEPAAQALLDALAAARSRLEPPVPA